MRVDYSVAQLPIETPMRRRARDSNLVSLSSRDDPVLEEYLHLIYQGAQMFDKTVDRRHAAGGGGAAAVTAAMSAVDTVHKQLLFFSSDFGISLRRDVDAFGCNPVVIVYAIAPTSPAAGLLGIGDQLVAVDGKAVGCEWRAALC
jgi:hypothetical protein